MPEMRSHPTALLTVAAVLLAVMTMCTFASTFTDTMTAAQDGILAQAVTARGDSPRAGEWPIITPDRAIALPADHVSHPDYKIEWWYYTGNLDTREGRRFGYQVTFFRVGVNRTPPNASRWAVRDLHMAHFAVSDLASGRFHVFDRLQREGAGWAGAAADRYEIGRAHV